MGWASGSRVMSGIIDVVQKEIPESEALRQTLYRGIVAVLRGEDWDTTDECLGVDPAYDRVYEELWNDAD